MADIGNLILTNDQARVRADGGEALRASRLAAFYRHRRVLVTGNTGLLGHWVAAILTSCGARLAGLARHPLNTRAFPVYQADIRDAEAVATAVQNSAATVVVHLAAQSKTRASDARATYETNILGTLNVLDAVTRHSVGSCVVVSSSRDPRVQSIDQASTDPYNLSKLAAEHIVAGYREMALRSSPARGLVIARPAVLIGGGDLASGRLVPDVMQALRRGESPRAAAPSSYRPWQHAIEAAAGILWLAAKLTETSGALAGAYNFGYPGSAPHVSAGELTELLAAHWLQQPVRSGDPAPPKDGFWLDDAQARQDLGWSSCWSIQRAVHATAAWHRADDEGPEAACLETIAQVYQYTADAASARREWAMSAPPSG